VTCADFVRKIVQLDSVPSRCPPPLAAAPVTRFSPPQRGVTPPPPPLPSASVESQCTLLPPRPPRPPQPASGGTPLPASTAAAHAGRGVTTPPGAAATARVPESRQGGHFAPLRGYQRRAVRAAAPLRPPHRRLAPWDEAPLATAAAAAVRARAGQVPSSATPDLQVGRRRRGAGRTHGVGRAVPARALPASAGAVAHGGVEYARGSRPPVSVLK